MDLPGKEAIWSMVEWLLGPLMVGLCVPMLRHLVKVTLFFFLSFKVLSHHKNPSKSTRNSDLFFLEVNPVLMNIFKRTEPHAWKTSCCWFSSTLPLQPATVAYKKMVLSCVFQMSTTFGCLRCFHGGWKSKELPIISRKKPPIFTSAPKVNRLQKAPMGTQIPFHVFVVISTHIWLVVERNPIWTILYSQIENLPQNSGEHNRYLSCHHLDLVGLLLTLSIFPIGSQGVL